MHTTARLGLLGLLALAAGLAPAFAQITPALAAELDRMLAQVADAPADRNPAERARRLELLGDIEVRASMLAAARSAFEEASALRTASAPDDRDLGRLAFKLAGVARLDKRPGDAERLVELAVTRLRTGAPQSAEFADALLESARAALARNDAARAEQTYREALDVVSKIEPGSPREAQVVEQLGDFAVRRKDLEAADRYYARGLAVLETGRRSSIDYARLANALAVVAAQRNQLPRALQLYEASLKIYEAERPDGLEVAQLLTNLGILQMNRGDLASAESMFRRALTIKSSRKSTPEDVAQTRANLGLVLFERGRLDEAATEFRAAVDGRRSQAPPLEVAMLLTSLARAERLLGRVDRASAAAREALDLRRAQAPQSLLVAAAATELGLAREGARAWDEALALHRDALGIREKLAPGSIDVAESLERVAVVMAASGVDPLATRNAFERAVDQWSRVSAGSLDHAHVVHELGVFLTGRGETDEGLRRLREAVDLIERSRAARLEGTPAARVQLVSRLRAYYGAPLGVLAERGDAGEAFTLLDRLHERLRRARCESCEDPAGRPSVSPVDALRRLIETGTLVVAFSVQPEATYAFLGTRDMPMRVYRIDEKAAALAARVEAFTEKVRARAGAAAFESPVVADGRALFALLFGQFGDLAARADRLLVIPDGPLELLPFAALARPLSRVSWEFLIDWKPMVFAPSVSLAAAWSGGAAVPAQVGQLFPTTPDEAASGPKLAGPAMPAGALVSLWAPADGIAAEMVELFKTGAAQNRSREAALVRAQRVLRDERGRSHPIYWAAFRYYGSRGAK